MKTAAWASPIDPKMEVLLKSWYATGGIGVPEKHMKNENQTKVW